MSGSKHFNYTTYLLSLVLFFLSLGKGRNRTGKMITLKAIQTILTPTKHALLQRRGLPKRNHSTLFLCKSNDPDSSQAPPPPEGDTRQQEILARIAMLQTEKVRLSDYLDETSANLTKFTQKANAEFDQIGEEARKEIQQSGERVCLASYQKHGKSSG